MKSFRIIVLVAGVLSAGVSCSEARPDASVAQSGPRVRPIGMCFADWRGDGVFDGLCHDRDGRELNTFEFGLCFDMSGHVVGWKGPYGQEFFM